MASELPPRSWPERLTAASKVRLVIAGNRTKYLKFCRDGKLMPEHEARYITHWSHLEGRSKDLYEVVLVAGWQEDREWELRGQYIAKRLGLSVREA